MVNESTKFLFVDSLTIALRALVSKTHIEILS